MKKLLALILALAMTLSLAACGAASNGSAGTSGTSGSAAASGEKAGTDTEAGSFKIGYNQLVTGDFALDALANNMETAIEGLGCEAMGVVAGGSMEQMVTDIENMISSGCDALVLWLPIDSLYLTVAQMCEDAGVYWALADKLPSDELLEQLYTYQYFVGGIAPNNYSYGQSLAQYALDQGYKSAYILAPGIGDGTATPRIEGFTKVFTEGGGTILGEAHTDDSNEAVTQAEDMYLTYGDQADCILATGASTFGTAALTILEKYNDHDLKILTGDLDQTILNSMADEDYVASDAGDYWVSGVFASVMVVNALNGNIWDDGGHVPALMDIPSFVVPAEQLDLFNNYIVGKSLYSGDELKTMVGITLDEYKKTVEAYSLESRFIAKNAEGTISDEELAAAGISVN